MRRSRRAHGAGIRCRLGHNANLLEELVNGRKGEVSRYTPDSKGNLPMNFVTKCNPWAMLDVDVVVPHMGGRAGNLVASEAYGTGSHVPNDPAFVTNR